MKSLKEFILQYTELPEDEWQLISQSFEKKEFRKNEYILKEGKICRYFYFMERGLIRFWYNLDGNDITKTFAIAPYCFTSKKSFRQQSPATENIQTLVKTVTWQIRYTEYRKLDSLPSWNLFMRKLLNEIQEFSEDMSLEAKTETAENRYLKLLKNYPLEVLDKIPLKHLSTYLGIAPQSLSRIRKKMKGNPEN